MTDNELRFYYINMKLKHNTWRIMMKRSIYADWRNFS